MPNYLKNSQAGSTKSLRKVSLTEFIRDTFSSKRLRTASFPVAIVLVKKSSRIWTLDYSGKLSMRLVDTELEALAYTFLVNRSYIQGSLTLSIISREAIKATLSCSQRTGLKSMTASMKLYPAGLRRLTGRIEERQDLQSQPY